MVSQVSGGALSPQVLRLLGVGGSKIGAKEGIAALASGVASADRMGDAAALSVSAGIHSEMMSLRSAGKGIAAELSLLQVAEGNLQEVASGLEEMHDLAVSAQDETLSGEERDAKTQRLLEILENIDAKASDASFKGRKVLDGSYTHDRMDDDFFIRDMRAPAIFDGTLSLDTAESAGKSVEVIAKAFGRVADEHQKVATYQGRLDYTSTMIDIALQNHDAAQASLEGTEIFGEGDSDVTQLLRYQSGLASETQGNNLNGNLLALLRV